MSPNNSGGDLEALEEPSDPSAGTSEKRRFPCLCAHNRLRPKRPLANEQSQMGTDRLTRFAF